MYTPYLNVFKDNFDLDVDYFVLNLKVTPQKCGCFRVLHLNYCPKVWNLSDWMLYKLDVSIDDVLVNLII